MMGRHERLTEGGEATQGTVHSPGHPPLWARHHWKRDRDEGDEGTGQGGDALGPATAAQTAEETPRARLLAPRLPGMLGISKLFFFFFFE